MEEWEKEWLKERWLPSTAADPYSNPNLKRGEPRLGAALKSVLGLPRLRRRSHREVA